MGIQRELEARKNDTGSTTHFGCSRCSWNVTYSRVNMFKSRFRPEEIAMMFFNIHECETHRQLSTGAEGQPLAAQAKDAA